MAFRAVYKDGRGATFSAPVDKLPDGSWIMRSADGQQLPIHLTFDDDAAGPLTFVEYREEPEPADLRLHVEPRQPGQSSFRQLQEARAASIDAERKQRQAARTEIQKLAPKPNKEVMEIEMNNLPAPIVGKSASDTQFNAFQENLDTATQGYVKMPGSESPKEVRQRVEAEAAKKAGATHVYDPGSGQTIPVGKTPVKNYKGQVLGYFLSGDSGEWVRFPKQ